MMVGRQSRQVRNEQLPVGSRNAYLPIGRRAAVAAWIMSVLSVGMAERNYNTRAKERNE